MTSAWTKAAAFGSLWAASEIVLGNLLHSLRVPLAGTLLAAIGVSILVAGLRLRGEPGVALRTGVVCALMKSVSPGAVIIGPMVGIMLEASIMEGVTRLTRRTVPGLLLAGGLATATPILQKIGSLLVTYGADAANIYIGLYEFAASSLAIRGLGPVTLLLVFAAAAALFGLVAAAAGLRMASLAQQTAADPLPIDATQSAFTFDATSDGQTYSLPLLACHVAALVLGLTLLATIPLWAAAIPVAAYAAFSFLRYRRVAQKFTRPRLWVEFAIIAVLAAVALGVLAPGKGLGDGLYAGGQMLARGILVIVAFSSISVELRNPAVVRWVLANSLGGAADAVSVATGALPGILQLLGNERQVLRHPLRAFSRSLAATVAWIDTAEKREPSPAPVFILSGGRGTGKTTTLEEIVRLLRSDGIEPRGFLSPVVRDHDDRLGYDLQVLGNGARIPLARRGSPEAASTAGAMRAGSFTFFPDAIRAGRTELDGARTRTTALIIIDEVGPLELQGLGWAPALLPLIIARTHPLVLVVRPSLVPEVCARWNFEPAKIWDASVLDARTIRTDLRLAFTSRTLYSHDRNGYLAGVAR